MLARATSHTCGNTHRFILALRYRYGSAFIGLTPRWACFALDEMAPSSE